VLYLYLNKIEGIHQIIMQV